MIAEESKKDNKVNSITKRAKLNIRGFYTTHKGSKQNFEKDFDTFKDKRHVDKF